MANDKNNGTLGCLGIIFIVLLITGVMKLVGVGDSSRDSGSGTNHSNSDFEISAKIVGRDRLKAQLRDPDSLQIISEQIVRPGRNGGTVGYECRYRAKNGFGGYMVDTFYTE